MAELALTRRVVFRAFERSLLKQHWGRPLAQLAERAEAFPCSAAASEYHLDLRPRLSETLVQRRALVHRRSHLDKTNPETGPLRASPQDLDIQCRPIVPEIWRVYTHLRENPRGQA